MFRNGKPKKSQLFILRNGFNSLVHLFVTEINTWNQICFLTHTYLFYNFRCVSRGSVIPRCGGSVSKQKKALHLRPKRLGNCEKINGTYPNTQNHVKTRFIVLIVNQVLFIWPFFFLDFVSKNTETPRKLEPLKKKPRKNENWYFKCTE